MGEEDKKKPVDVQKTDVLELEVKKEAEEKPAEAIKVVVQEEEQQSKDETTPTEAIKEAKEEAVPQEIVLRVFMHCEGCARKVRRCLKGYEGVESVETNCKNHIVVVKGEKADPLKVLERVQRKSHRRVQLISPIPEPQASMLEKKAQQIEKPKPEEKKEEPPVVTVVLEVHMHCEACAQEMKRRMLKMKGVETVDADLKSSQVAVKGAVDPQAVVEYVHRRTGKHAVIVKQHPEKQEPKSTNEEQKPDGDGDDDGGETVKKEEENEEKEEAKEEKNGREENAEADEGEVEQVGEMKKSEYYGQYNNNNNNNSRYMREMYAYPVAQVEVVGDGYNMTAPGKYAPQMFSDENPNACFIM